MNSRNNYLLDKYSSRKKIRLIRKRVLLRKFGYLFFRKTISVILPSTAQRHYLENIKRNAFLKLKNNWYKKRIEWKYNLRAKLHFNFFLKKRYFKKLALFYIEKKTKQVKQTIAQVMFEKNDRKNVLRFSFTKWRRYINYKKNKNLKNTIADQHFKLRWKIRRLRPYFFKWRVFTVNSKIIRSKIENASRLFDNKLLNRVFNAFLLYSQCRRLRKEQMGRASLFYSRKIKQKAFNKLVCYRTHSLFHKEKYELVMLFYKKKLTEHCLAVLRKNVERIRFKKERLAIFNERKSIRMKKTAIATWKFYVMNKKEKKKKRGKADNFYDFQMKNRCFQKVKKYSIYKKEKRNYQIVKGTKIALIFKKIMLSNFFEAWRWFINLQINKKRKLELALSHFVLKLTKRHFHSWLNFKDYKKNKRYERMELDNHFNYRLLRNCLSTWKSFLDQKRFYNAKLSEAKKYYRDNLIRENFRLIIKTAMRIKDENLANHLENEKRRMMLAQKYSRIWKMKSKYCNKLLKHPVRAVRHYDQEKMVAVDITPGYEKPNLQSVSLSDRSLFSPLSEGFSDVFQWDPMCFAKPRVPDYMKNC